MNRRIPCIALLLSASMPLFAQDATSPAPMTPASNAEPTGPADDAKVDRFCLRETGTHIRRRAPHADGRPSCPSLHSGRVYTQEDLRMTGEIDVAEALRKLDPAIR
jgi:hypothetical protein